ncbi:MAG TPA: type 2 lanthipeptide synthetase LanM [Pirellulales bacterium]
MSLANMRPENPRQDNDLETNEPLGLLQIFSGPINEARQALSADLHALREEYAELASTLLSDPAAMASLLFRQLTPGLLLKASRTLTLELNVARLLGELVGETPAERYRSFLKRLGQPEVAQAILTEYPVLERQALLFIQQWRQFSLEFIRHLCADWPRICNAFGLTAADAGLADLKGDAGDRHCDGRTVQLLTLRSGRKLVYKPRSLAADLRFQELLTWCNERGAEPRFRTLAMLDCGNHGWVEFVSHADCQDAGQISRYYRRQGAYLALLHAVGANDIHFENLIASGEHPMLVDLETLFHQRLPGLSQDPAGEGMSHSVISVRLLPRVSYVEGVESGIDFSALGAKAGQEIPYPERRFESDGTDEMHVRQGHAVVPKGTHRPTLLGAEVSLASHEHDLTRGYLEMYQLLLRERDGLLAADSPLAAFAEVETRFIARVSQIYFIFLDHSFHPDLLRNGLDRDQWFKGLWQQVDLFPGLAPLVHAERAALDRNDIPLFHACPSSRDLVGSNGERIENFFDRTALEMAYDRIRRMGPDDLARQTWMIRSSLAMLPDASSAAETQGEETLDFSLSPDECIAAARRLGDRLAALAYETEHEAGWLGFQSQERGWSIGALDLDPHDGLPGVALFLLELGLATGKRRYAELARKTMVGVTRRLAAAEPGDISTDLRTLLAELAELGPCFDNPLLREEIGYAVRLANAAPHSDEPTAAVGPLRPRRALPRRFEAPGLRGGLAGRGHELLRRANAAVFRPAHAVAEAWA